jgi:glycosyltransferase involved in cell wall biosynthesis
VEGKFLYVASHKLYLRGVTYGPFRPDESGCTYHNPDIARRDFAAMRAIGINAVRTYTVPPNWLLDVAHEQGVRVLAGVGLAGEQLVAFLDDRRLKKDVRRRCAADVRACSGHPAVLAYAIGNEIPAPIVRWHGRRRVERFLADLYDLAKEQDPTGLVTYVNYPTTEYLQLPFLDFHAYNVYLECGQSLAAYLARLQNLSGNKPLVMAEMGLDSLRHGVRTQARSIERQVRTAFAAGCAGAFVFAWTDEWHTGGLDIEDWRFGITDHLRRPKPAISRTRRAFEAVPFCAGRRLPKVSVIVCTYNGGRTIGECLNGLDRLKYPNYEVIVVDDGSTDSTPQIVARHNVKLISTDNHGLSSARNTGLRAASGEYVAYIDDDAWPDPHWLDYLVHTFETSDYAGVGGPNLVPPDDGPVSQCVANSPGGPTHVLLTDQLAEHIPGCNMAFRASRLREIGAFDSQFRIAGDDVDVCWRLQDKGYTLGFHPTAIVWHRRRNSVRAYLRQQFNYGRAEAMLEVKWPQKYNAIGHICWRGRLYGGASGGSGIGFWPSRIYHGVWASQPFQSLYTPAATVAALPLMPEWYLLVIALLGLGALGWVWHPLLTALPLAALALVVSVVQALRAARLAQAATEWRGSRGARVRQCALTASLHLVQPIVRLWGRMSFGLTPWRRRRPPRLARALCPTPQSNAAWSESWETAEQRLAAVERILRGKTIPLRRGGPFDEWDLEVRDGLFACARTRMAIEQYPAGHQFVRFRNWRCFPVLGVLSILALALLGLGAACGHAPVAAAVLGAMALLMTARAAGDGAAAIETLENALQEYCDEVQKGARPRPESSARIEQKLHALPADLDEVLEPAGGQT